MRSLHGAGQWRRRWRSRRGDWKPTRETQRRWVIASLLYLDKGDIEQAGKLSATALEAEPDDIAALVHARVGRVGHGKNPTTRGSISSARSP